MCYRYERLSHDCDEAAASRTNRLDGTANFASAYLLKSCDGDSRQVPPEPTRPPEQSRLSTAAAAGPPTQVADSDPRGPDGRVPPRRRNSPRPAWSTRSCR